MRSAFYKVVCIENGEMFPEVTTAYTYRMARMLFITSVQAGNADERFQVYKYYLHRSPRPVGPAEIGLKEI